MRVNIQALLCFYVQSENELKGIYAEMGISTFKQFKKLLQDATREPYSFFLITRDTPGAPKFFCNFKMVDTSTL